MYLYDKKDDRLDIYSLEPKQKEIEEYKREEMQKFLKEKKDECSWNTGICKAISGPNNLILKKRCIFDWQLLHKNGYKDFHAIKMYGSDEQDQINRILENFYTNLWNYKTVIIKNLDDIESFLLLMGEYYEDSTNILGITKFVMDPILQLPLSLYLLQNINAGNGLFMYDWDITEQAKLFELSEEPVESYPLEHLDSLIKYGLVKDLSDVRINENQALIKSLRLVNKSNNK